MSSVFCSYANLYSNSIVMTKYEQRLANSCFYFHCTKAGCICQHFSPCNIYKINIQLFSDFCHKMNFFDFLIYNILYLICCTTIIYRLKLKKHRNRCFFVYLFFLKKSLKILEHSSFRTPLVISGLKSG